VAVAITVVAHGEWQGYGSYRAVNRALLEHGLSTHDKDLARLGVKHYFEVMTDSARFGAALRAASTLRNPASEGIYYSQDEKGMAAFYVAAFALFGIAPSSLFWLYLSLYAAAMAVACAAFRRDAAVLFFLLAVACVHALVAMLLPRIPPQDINVIYGNRFIGLLAVVPMFHLMFLLLQRTRASPWQVAGALFQTAIIFLVVNARTSAAWLLIAVMLLWLGLLALAVLRRLRRRPAGAPLTVWPIALLVLGLVVSQLHQNIIVDSAFRDGRAHGGHVFWHNLATALHNHPERTARYGIPADMPIYDDQVSFVLFDGEIAARGEPLTKYISGDADWVFRTNVRERDFLWAAYDGVVRDVFLRTIAADPGYALYAFAVQQPISALNVMLGPDFLRAKALRRPWPIVALVAGLLLFAFTSRADTSVYAGPLAAATLGAVLPVVAAAAVELRVVELFYMMLLALAVVAAMFVLAALRPVRGRFA
jgi:hypothetical protein